MDYQQHLAEYRRLLILQHLDKSAAYTAHEQDLKRALATTGVAVGSDLLRADLQWLHEQGLLLASQPGGVWVATLTARGGDVQNGLSTVPGVARPEPV